MTATERGLTLPCPCCGEAEATVLLSLADLESCHCADCDADFTLADVRAFLDRWGKVLVWVGTFPAA